MIPIGKRSPAQSLKWRTYKENTMMMVVVVITIITWNIFTTGSIEQLWLDWDGSHDLSSRAQHASTW